MNKSKQSRSRIDLNGPYSNNRESVRSKSQGINAAAAKSANFLDSCPPLLNRGKEKEKPKTKKHSTLKKVRYILIEIVNFLISFYSAYFIEKFYPLNLYNKSKLCW